MFTIEYRSNLQGPFVSLSHISIGTTLIPISREAFDKIYDLACKSFHSKCLMQSGSIWHCKSTIYGNENDAYDIPYEIRFLKDGKIYVHDNPWRINLCN